MSWPTALILLLGSLVCMMALGLPVVFAFFGVNLLGALVFLMTGFGLGWVNAVMPASSSSCETCLRR